MARKSDKALFGRKFSIKLSEDLLVPWLKKRINVSTLPRSAKTIICELLKLVQNIEPPKQLETKNREIYAFCPLGENRGKHKCREDEAPEVGRGQANVGFYTFIPRTIDWSKISCFPTAKPFRNCSREYRPYAAGDVWFIHEGVSVRFSIVVTIFMLHILVGGFEVVSLLLGLHASLDLNPLDIFYLGHLKSLVYEMPVATVEYLTPRIFVTSADVANNIRFFDRVRHSIVVGCSMNYATATSNYYFML
ncbi:uncharacterized protein TNCV_3231801 [Trichonephila clavipes]|nr:uncharacterized protein TNCV_3231801 [Trichonephila clavipes]